MAFRVFFIGSGIVCIARALMKLGRYIKICMIGQTTKGNIVEFRTRWYGLRFRMPGPIVFYIVNNNIYKQDWDGSGARIGESVEVTYDPKHPERIIEASFTTFFVCLFFAVLLGIAGFMLLFLGITYKF